MSGLWGREGDLATCSGGGLRAASSGTPDPTACPTLLVWLPTVWVRAPLPKLKLSHHAYQPLTPALLPRPSSPPLRCPCHSTAKIENKIALRCVQNADIHLQEAFVPDADRLPGACGMG